MDETASREKLLYLVQVEKLSGKQIQKTMSISYRRLKRLLLADYPKNPIPNQSCVLPYGDLIRHWYHQYPRLQGTQIYERLKSYEFTGSYSSVLRFTRKYRGKKEKAYHALSFLPSQEAQIDWFFINTEELGQLAGFLYLLSYSRYAWGRFYRRTGFEFFLKAHLDVFCHLKGFARTHRYDNIKSVIIRRAPVIEYNTAFLEFSRYYGFRIHVCNPYSGNEKGRVERLIRDIRAWLYGKVFKTLEELNEAFLEWLRQRNQRIHRATEKSPIVLLADERLMMLPEKPYPTRRVILSRVSKTALVEYDSNRYSVPSDFAGKPCEILVAPERIEIHAYRRRIASHKRSFERKKIIQNPLHQERLLERSPNFKTKRILELIRMMEMSFRTFLDKHEDPREEAAAAYEIFRLLKTHSRRMLVSAVSELNRMGTFKIRALKSLLNLPSPKESGQLFPQNENLMDLNYDPRRLEDYDPL